MRLIWIRAHAGHYLVLSAPIHIFAGASRAEPDPCDLRGRVCVTRADRPWWAPGPFVRAAVVVMAEDGTITITRD